MNATNDRTTKLYAAAPGEILKAEIESRNLQKKSFAKKIGMQPSHLSELFNGKRRFTPTVAKRIEDELGISADFWVRLQKDRDFDLKVIARRRKTKRIDDVVRKILQEAECHGAKDTSPMFVQKMLYYQQGYHLARFGTPLFAEDIEAWKFGPVVPAVYSKYERYGETSIAKPKARAVLFAPEEEDLFYAVYEKFSHFDAYELMMRTHKEKPWKEAMGKGANTVITTESMREFFKNKRV